MVVNVIRGCAIYAYMIGCHAGERSRRKGENLIETYKIRDVVDGLCDGFQDSIRSASRIGVQSESQGSG